MSNRLHLNFQINSTNERTQYIKEYLKREEFQKKPLTEEELETCANYILWGKDNDGKNCVQRKEIEIETRNKTWSKKEDESLDGLLESPTFNENQILGPNSIRTKIPREVFDREKALKNCPPQLIPSFKELFSQIDRLDLILNYYDLIHDKRKNPPRAELLNQFSQEEQEKLFQEAKALNQFKYLKMRHLLVELRRQQFTLKDSYSSYIQRHTFPIYDYIPDKISFETEINVLPLGLKNQTKVSSLIFQKEFIPENYSEKDKQIISDLIWEHQKELDSSIDFRELEHVYNIFQLYFDLEDEVLKKEIESETDSLLETLEYYIELANLNKIQKEILNLKIKKQKNQDIANYINKKYQKTYTANYISTIFRQKIIKQINEAATFHFDNISNIFFEENFKKCTCCGKTLLKDSRNFVRKTRAKDGFSNRCKKCDKKERELRKEGK